MALKTPQRLSMDGMIPPSAVAILPVAVSSSSAIRERLTQIASELPAAPEVFARLTQLLQLPFCDMEEVAELVAMDPAIAGQVLARANSVFFKGEQGVGSVREAAVRLGVVEVHRAVGVAMASQLFASHLPLYSLTGESMWSNSVAGALCMEALARHAGVDTHEAYTLGLLRQIGKLALSQIAERERWGLHMPPEADLLAWEKSRFDFTHLEASAEILSTWKMPPRMGQALRHSLEVGTGPEAQMAALLHITGWVIEQLGLHVPSEFGLWKMTPQIWETAKVREDLVHSAVDETKTEWEALLSMVQ